MEMVLRAAAVYMILLVVMRLSGRRTLAQMSSFDLVLLLIISETTQQALIGEDFSVTRATVAIVTLVGMELLFTGLQLASRTAEKWMDGVPSILVQDGQLVEEVMKKSRVAEADILQAARERQGISRMDQIKYAILEKSGGITVIPR